MKGVVLASIVVLLMFLRAAEVRPQPVARPKGTTRRNSGQRELMKGGKGGGSKVKSSKKEKGAASSDATALEAKESDDVTALEAKESVNVTATMIMIPPLSMVTKSPDNATQVVVAYESDETTLPDGPPLQCPMSGYKEFTIRKTSTPFVRYPLTMRDQNVVLSVTETCSYMIEDLSGAKGIVYLSSPLEWLDTAVYHFGGSPRSRKNGLKFRDDEALSLLDIDFIDRGADVFEVVLPSNSSNVDKGKPISWIFLSEEEAVEFEYFVASLVRYAPEIFLTSESSHCGSGPFCDVVGNTVCYHDPMNNDTFGIIHLNGDEDKYDDAYAWFSDCVSGLDCFTDTNSTFSYSPCPAFTVNDTSFIFTDDKSNEITFHCPTASSVLRVAELVEKLSMDPFHALAIGGPHNDVVITNCIG